MHAGKPVLGLSDKRFSYHEEYEDWVFILRKKNILFCELDELVDEIKCILQAGDLKWDETLSDPDVAQYRKMYCGVGQEPINNLLLKNALPSLR